MGKTGFSLLRRLGSRRKVKMSMKIIVIEVKIV